MADDIRDVDIDDVYSGILENGREAQRRFVDQSLSLDAAHYNGNLSEILSSEQDRLAAELGIKRRGRNTDSNSADAGSDGDAPDDSQ